MVADLELRQRNDRRDARKTRDESVRAELLREAPSRVGVPRWQTGKGV